MNVPYVWNKNTYNVCFAGAVWVILDWTICFENISKSMPRNMILNKIGDSVQLVPTAHDGAVAISMTRIKLSPCLDILKILAMDVLQIKQVSEIFCSVKT